MNKMPLAHRHLISPSQVYCTAAGISPMATMRMPDDGHCACCGVRLPAGSDCARFEPAATFNNLNDLSDPDAAWTCVFCPTMFERQWMQTYATSYACSSGVFSLASGADLARLVRDPPSAPFVAVMGTASIQHLVWRAPVNWSCEKFIIQRGDERLMIVRDAALQALEQWRALQAFMTRQGMSGPPAMLRSALDRPAVGRVRGDVEQAVQAGRSPELGAAVQMLNSMSMGGWLALHALCDQGDAPNLPPRRQIASPDGWRAPTQRQREAADPVVGGGGEPATRAKPRRR